MCQLQSVVNSDVKEGLEESPILCFELVLPLCDQISPRALHQNVIWTILSSSQQWNCYSPVGLTQLMPKMVLISRFVMDLMDSLANPWRGGGDHET